MHEKLLNIEYFLLDLDGTIYLDDHLLPGSLEFLATLEKNNTPYLFLTNNSSKSKEDYLVKLSNLGININEDQIFTSGDATISYLKQKQPNASIYLVGTPSLEKTFTSNGFNLTENRPDFVVLGFDTTLTYQKLWTLCDWIRAGVPYIATHPDINCPTKNGFMPDIGAMMALIEASTGKKPDVVIGKPHQPMIDAISEKTQLRPTQMGMVGDRLYTDIAMGQYGLVSILVLSGETKMSDLDTSPIQPTYVFENVGELATVLQNLPLGK